MISFFKRHRWIYRVIFIELKLTENIKNLEPKIRHIMAPTRRIDEIGSGIPFEEMYSTVLSKSFILPGIAEINIAEIDNLEKKSKKDLILLFFKKEFFII